MARCGLWVKSLSSADGSCFCIAWNGMEWLQTESKAISGRYEIA